LILQKTIAAVAILATGWFGLLAGASAFDMPGAQCNLNADKSTLQVVVSNPASESYACAMACHYKVAGERLFQAFNCNFSLSPNSGDKVACDLEGNAPGYFAEARGAQLMCQPR